MAPESLSIALYSDFSQCLSPLVFWGLAKLSPGVAFRPPPSDPRGFPSVRGRGRARAFGFIYAMALIGLVSAKANSRMIYVEDKFIPGPID